MNWVILMRDMRNFAYKVNKNIPMDIALPMGISRFACKMFYCGPLYSAL